MAAFRRLREFLWSEIRRNYPDHGVRVWWLDACEPELRPVQPAGLRFHAGPGDEVYNLYPRDHARGFYEGSSARPRQGSDESMGVLSTNLAGTRVERKPETLVPC